MPVLAHPGLHRQVAGLADIHSAYGLAGDDPGLVDPQIDVAEPAAVLFADTEGVLGVAVGQADHEVVEVALQRVVAELTDDCRGRVVDRHVPRVDLVAVLPHLGAFRHPRPARGIEQRRLQVLAAVRTLDVGVAEPVGRVAHVVPRQLDHSAAVPGHDEVVEEVRKHPLVALPALAHVVRLVA
ncbi:hypothetical protein D9M71_599390 [compost metagenome]